MGKYEPLGQFLRKQKRDRIVMTFAEIERVLNAKLPASKKSRAFWSNNPDNNVMTREWMKAGYETEAVDTASGKLVFRRRKVAKKNKPWEKVYGCMKGMIIFAPGYDPAQPIDPEDWGDGTIGGLHDL